MKTCIKIMWSLKVFINDFPISLPANEVWILLRLMD